MTHVPYILLLIGGFGALWFGAEWLVRGAARIATKMGVSPVVIGLTLVSLGTSAPELVVGIVAALDERTGLLIGNVMGSNLANIGLILGATAVIRPLAVADRVISRDVPIMVLVTIFIFPLMLDNTVVLGDGLILLVVLVLYVAFTFRTVDEDMSQLDEGAGGDSEEAADAARELLVNLGLVTAGAIGLGLGGKAIVEGASYLASELGASEELIGLTVVAVGTSLPELVTSVVAAARQQTDIAVGNIVGSNIFNLTAVLGASALVSELPVDPSILTRQLPAVLVISLLAWPITASARRVRRSEGVLLLAAYFGFMIWITVG